MKICRQVIGREGAHSDFHDARLVADCIASLRVHSAIGRFALTLDDCLFPAHKILLPENLDVDLTLEKLKEKLEAEGYNSQFYYIGSGWKSISNGHALDAVAGGF